MKQAKQWVDVSLALSSGTPIWPGDTPLKITSVSRIRRGRGCNLSSISMSAHTGTHIDAPLHFISKGRSIDRIPLEAFIGNATVIEIQDPECITREELRRHRIKPGSRLLFKTLNSRKCRKQRHFVKNFVYIGTNAAEYLAFRRVRTVGIDYLSAGGYKKDSHEVHRILLKAGISIIEGLDLSSVNPGTYHMICLPLNLIGAEGAPARVILKPYR